MAVRHINIYLKEELRSKLEELGKYYMLTPQNTLSVLVARAYHGNRLDWVEAPKSGDMRQFAVSTPLGECIREIRANTGESIQNILYTLITDEHNELFNEAK